MGIRVMLRGVRMAFPELYEAKAFGGGDESTAAWGAKFILPPNHPQIAELDKAMKDAALEKWKDKGESALARLIEDKKVAWVKKPYKDANGTLYDGWTDADFSLSTRNSKTKPSTFGPDNQEVPESSGLLYGGAIVDASVEFFGQDNKWGRRINCSLRGVRHVAHGAAFSGGAPAAADEFGAPLEAPADSGAADAHDFV